MSDVDLQPDYEEVVQSEPSVEPPVKVCVSEIEGPVRTQVLPRKGGATGTKTVGMSPVELVRADPHRASVTIIAVGNPFYIALAPQSAQDPSTMMAWPVGVPYVNNSRTSVWVASSTGTTMISFATELWATGE